MPFQKDDINKGGSTGNYWVLISAAITPFPVANAHSQFTYGCFKDADHFNSGADPMDTHSFIISADLDASIRSTILTTLETFLSTFTYPVTNPDGSVTQTNGFFNGATQV